MKDREMRVFRKGIILYLKGLGVSAGLD